jgi:hypothetical protein
LYHKTYFRFWTAMLVIGPLIGLAAPAAIVWVFGGFEHTSGALTGLQAFGICGGLCLPLAAFFLAQERRARARARVSRIWPTVPGTVDSCDVQEREGRGGSTYVLALAYSYRVGERDYRGDHAAFGPRSSLDEALIDRLAEQYKTGGQVTVHYDPADPSAAVLDTGDEMAFGNSWKIFALVFFVVMATVIVAIRHLFRV